MVRMSGVLRSIVLGLLLPLAGGAQSPGGVANLSVFQGAGDSARVQAVWQLDPAVLRYKTDSAAGGIRAEYITSAQLLAGGKEVHRENWRVRTPLVQTAAQIGGLQLVDGWQIAAAPGTYTMQVSFWGPGWEDQAVIISLPVEVPAAASKEPAVSRPQFFDTAYAAPPKTFSPFAHAGRTRVPLATDFLGEERGRLHFYVEAYHFKENDFKRGKMRWKGTVLKGDAAVPGFSVENAAATGANWEGVIPVEALPSGNYLLKITLTDGSGKELASSERSFQRSNIGYKPPAADTTTPAAGDLVGPKGKPVDLKNAFVSKFTEDQLLKVLRMLLPQASPEEGVAIQQLSAKVDPMYRRGFIYTFWSTRSPEDPEGAWKAYADKVRIVNREFKTASRVGYETDRGRVYLHYGAPAERIKVVQESGSLPYEVWKYVDANGFTGAFLFYQAAGPLDDYAQLHSTVKGAVKNYNWRRFLYTNGANERSRAEQYFPERN